MPATSNVQNQNVSSYLAEKQHAIAGILNRKTDEASKTAKDVFETSKTKFDEGKGKVRAGLNDAGHKIQLAAHRSATTSPYSIIDWKKGLTISGILAGAAACAYYATTAAVTIALTLTPAIVLAAAAAVVAVATLWSLAANALTKPTVPEGVDPLDVDTDVQTVLNAMEAERNRWAKMHAELSELASQKEQDGVEKKKDGDAAQREADLLKQAS